MLYDEKERRCPRLGSVVSFRFCRTSENGRPCFKVLDCWWESFDVTAYFKACLSPEAFDRLAHPAPPNKVASLLDVIRQAQARLVEK